MSINAPRKEVKELLKFFCGRKSKKTVLDLGCGYGRNALFLAKHGFNVTAVDSSREKIEKLKQIAKDNDLKIKAILKDVLQFDFKRNYDIIIASYILHFFKKKKGLEILKKIKDNTSKNGINLIMDLTEKDPYFDSSKCFFKLGELRKQYIGWKILKYREKFTALERHDNLPLHKHHIVVLIAKKNGKE